MTRLSAVRETEIPDQEAIESIRQHDQTHAEQMAKAQAMQAAATQMLFTALKALSQRFVVALANLFALLTIASAFYLWAVALRDLDNTKIVGLSIYSAFILLFNIFGKRSEKR